MSHQGMARAVERMRDRGIGPEAITVFEHYYRQLEEGAQGTVPEDTIEPLRDIQALGEVRFSDEDARLALSQTAVIKLNGGLGTSMGMSGAKSALEVKDGLTFLDIIARQVLALREEWDVELPLILMNSFRTSEQSLEILAKYPTLPVDGLPLDFIQSAEPKLLADSLTPVDWPQDPELEWCPPGHGDIYVSLVTSGVLDSLLDKGIRYAFISNSDNLGATCDPEVAAWMVEHGLPFVAEVCDRTKSDRKGGHLARRKSDGRLILRDTAMVAEGEERFFADIRRHHTFNANNIWVDLAVLRDRMAERNGVLGLPIIINRKTVDPADPTSPEVVQLESAMGAAIEVFEGSEALLVPRTRFRPVKTTNDLLVVRSDYFVLDERHHLVAVGEGPEPFVDLDSAYRLVQGFEQRFPHGVPSMLECTSLRVIGDPVFGRNVRCVGDVLVDGLRRVHDNAVLEGPVEATADTRPSRAKGDGLRTVDEHLRAILSTLEPAPSASVPLTEALGLVVAKGVRSRVSLPSFDNSSMDGYAVQAASLQGADTTPVRLRLVGEVAAGTAPTCTVGPGEAARIMTGAPIPSGADAVIAVEDTDGAAEGEVLCRAAVPQGRYIRPSGEDVSEGAVIVSAGDVIGPRTIALLAACGHASVEVHRRPHVVVLSTGAELVPPGEPLGPGQIHDSNSPMLWAAAVSAGASAEIRAAVGDTDAELLSALDEVLATADVVVTSGGVSMGAYDVVKSALADQGVDFVRVAMQPGKPQGFGYLAAPDGRRVPLFALPGNPVSSFVSFEVFVRPALRRLMRRTPEKRRIRSATLTAGLRSFEGRRQFGRAVVRRNSEGALMCTPVAGQGSHFVADLSRANALFVVPEDTVDLVAGEAVDVIVLDD
ncbi:UTP--glucose-1-phosphate uridylyltransferase [Intrasporangium calvum]|uniref:molybdopterin molybdotransferase n=1 Tax=Intrasporangium calvum TaxID=53358 RepID=A0ABT5GJ11_9MICO|nr:gephyrin-like molybdotransferase Glp [Intrasporangium calvum]MDC5698197.1 UTP--glucose-1-phosphate uridylyltransferase [Intrasporangium calvum]